jgi:sugar phosphate isomerase/epimerase
MKIGLLTGVLGDRDRRSAFAHIRELGFDAVELGTGEFTTDVHAGLDSLSNDDRAVADLQRDLDEVGLELSALSCHNNSLHPDPEYAARADRVFRDTVEVAAKLGVKNVVCFSGCPGEPGGAYPNWITTPWPDYFGDLLEWQWTEKVIPYWTDAAAFASEHGTRIAIEMHPGMSVYNLPTLLRLRDACGHAIGANYDPSHLWWQGMDPLVVLGELADQDALFHVHAKDTYVDPWEVRRAGVLDTASHSARRRAWRFTTMGHGHDLAFWRALVSELCAANYDGVLSVEHEDSFAPVDEALKRSVAILEESIWRDPSAGASWLVGHDPPYRSTTSTTESTTSTTALAPGSGDAG